MAMPKAHSAIRCRPCGGTRLRIRCRTRAKPEGATTHGPVPQGEFLHRLGIAQRAARLKSNATLQQAADIEAALARLTAPDQMGELFKVLAIADAKLGRPPGFDT